MDPSTKAVRGPAPEGLRKQPGKTEVRLSAIGCCDDEIKQSVSGRAWQPDLRGVPAGRDIQHSSSYQQKNRGQPLLKCWPIPPINQNWVVLKALQRPMRNRGLSKAGYSNAKTADPFALLPVERHFQEGSAEQQVPPLRYASVRMTLLFGG